MPAFVDEKTAGQHTTTAVLPQGIGTAKRVKQMNLTRFRDDRNLLGMQGGYTARTRPFSEHQSKVDSAPNAFDIKRTVKDKGNIFLQNVCSVT